ncbi:glycine--tRNA ligase [Candidatus Dojkabacteria bacterium]|nr:glycine--tRNA ligase [Candidatus Dojkabacteria bacterium]
MATKAALEKIVSLCKRRGFIWPGSDLYGGMANTYDFGPYGVELKENIKKIWWEKFIHDRADMFGIDSSIFLNPKVWQASGHTESFVEIVVEDKVTNKRYRADHLIEDCFAKKGKEIKADGLPLSELSEIIKKEKIKSPDGNELTEPKKFKALFETKVGIIEGEGNTAYLRGEIAQGLFLNYKNIIDTFHPKLPFGIGQAGKAFRNEISQGQFTFRTLEFDLMEFEYFFDPERVDWNKLFDYWKSEIYDFALMLGINKRKLRWRPHEKFELSHYSKRTEDLEYKFSWGYKEMFACAYRTDFDLSNHMKNSGKDLSYQSENGKKFIPHVVEPTFGLSRVVTILIMDAYQEDTIKGRKRVYLKLDPKVSPVKVAVFPLQKDKKLEGIAQDICKELTSKISGNVIYDISGSIGKRYRRQDEIGTPYCITVDFESVDDQKVTIRNRDDLKQDRVGIDAVSGWILKKLA